MSMSNHVRMEILSQARRGRKVASHQRSPSTNHEPKKSISRAAKEATLASVGMAGFDKICNLSFHNHKGREKGNPLMLAPSYFRRNIMSNKNSIFSIVHIILVLAAILVPIHSSSIDDTSTTPSLSSESKKRVDEEEEEIGYIQTLLLNTPAISTRNSTYQKIEVYQSDHFGKVFLLDDCLQLTEKDAPHYNEMLAHVPMMEYISSIGHDGRNNELLDILVVGGGDGYVVSELLKYPNVGSIDHVDLDEEVINISKDYLPWAASVWDSPKVNLVVGDGAKFVKDQVEKGKNYHVIIQDASDPFWIRYDGSVVVLPSHVLYEEEHFQRMHKLLEANNGVLMFQAETYNIPSNLKEISKWRGLLQNIGFDRVRYGSIAISTYPTGQIGFFVSHSRVSSDDNVCNSSDAPSTCSEIDAADSSLDWIDWGKLSKTFNSLTGNTQYYHPPVHRSSFDLPLWVQKTIYNVESAGNTSGTQ